MSWLETLYQTYNANCDRNFAAMGETAILLPPFHTTKLAHIIVRIDDAGKFLGGKIITEKSERRTIIPCTEASGSRTANQAPHPLFDTLQYIAGDFTDYGALKRGDEDYRAYMKQLRAWCDFSSGSTRGKLEVIWKYLDRRTLIHDLVTAQLLPLAANGHLAMTPKDLPPDVPGPAIFKAVTGDVSKAVVIFEYYAPGNLDVKLWQDPDLRQSWYDYQTKQTETGKPALCQISGKIAPAARLHPRKIRNEGDGTKLISGNDSSNFTFRGRFETCEQAGSISLDVSLKAHAALRWLIERQGYHNDSLCIVAWALGERPDVPALWRGTDDLLKSEFSMFNEEMPETPPNDQNAGREEGRALSFLLAGYTRAIHPERMMVMVLDSATPGTLAIKYYRELAKTELLERVLYWHTQCAWQQFFGKERQFYGAPAPYEIIKAAYGLNVDGSLCRNAELRLLPCLIESRPLPHDILDSVFYRTSRPDTLDGNWEFSKNIGIFCALYRYSNPQKRSCTMALLRDYNSRDYLFGRLLAVSDYLETQVLKNAENNRLSNAMRLMTHFAAHPASTWAMLHQKLQPYSDRLCANDHGCWIAIQKLFQEIHDLFKPEDFDSDQPLKGEYLLGFYCQRADFYRKKEQESSPEQTDLTNQN